MDSRCKLSRKGFSLKQRSPVPTARSVGVKRWDGGGMRRIESGGIMLGSDWLEDVLGVAGELPGHQIQASRAPFLCRCKVTRPSRSEVSDSLTEPAQAISARTQLW